MVPAWRICGAVGADEGIALAALDAADGQFVLVAELETVFLGELFHRCLAGDHGSCGRRFSRFLGQFLGQLTERFGQSHGGIGGNGPRSLEILLIHHGP